MDTARHNQLIEQLIPLTYKSNFAEVFKALTPGETTNARFLLKMELNRLTAPTRRLIDLRGKVDGECRPYEHQGLQHYLDEVAVRTFEQQLALHQGNYTMGVYEAMMHTENNFRIIGQRQGSRQRQQSAGESASTSEKTAIQTVKFGSYQSRREERMHLSIPVQLLQADGQQVAATTSDISARGLKIKVAKEALVAKGTDLTIKFTGFEQEFASPALTRGIGYRVVGTEHKEQLYWLKLIRTRENNEFDRFIRAFIKGNRMRYKINLDNVEQTIRTKGYEQSYLRHSAALPLFFGGDNGLTLRHLLQTDKNRQIIAQWRDEACHSYLGAFFTPALMQQLTSQPGKLKETLIFSFSLIKGSRRGYYAATREQLADHGLTGLFLSYAARQPSWRVYKLQLMAADISDAEHQSVLPLKDKFEIPKVTFERLAPLHWVGTLRDITTPADSAQYRQWPVDNDNIQQLRRFAINGQIDDIEVIPYRFEEQRRAQRYSYETKVTLATPSGTTQGTTVDFSADGLRVTLSSPLDGVEPGQAVYIALPALQAVAKNARLAQLPYEVVSRNPTGTRVHLKIPDQQTGHSGQNFFKMLIRRNTDKLRPLPAPAPSRGSDFALRNACMAALMSNPVFAHRHGRTLQVESVGITGYPDRVDTLLRLGSPEENLQLYPLFKQSLQQKVLEAPISELPPETASGTQRLYIHINNDADLPPKLRVDNRLETGFANERERQQFVRNAAGNGQLIVFQLTLSRCGRPDLDYLANELKYVGQFAGHKARQLEEQLWSIEAMIDIVDVTEETHFRYRLPCPQAATVIR